MVFCHQGCHVWHCWYDSKQVVCPRHWACSDLFPLGWFFLLICDCFQHEAFAMMPEGHRRMKWLFRYGQILMKKIIKFNTIKTDFLLCRIIQDYRVENYVQEMRCWMIFYCSVFLCPLKSVKCRHTMILYELHRTGSKKYEWYTSKKIGDFVYFRYLAEIYGWRTQTEPEIDTEYFEKRVWNDGWQESREKKPLKSDWIWKQYWISRSITERYFQKKGFCII